MRVLIAPDAFAGSLSAGQVAVAMARGWHEQAPGDALVTLALSDGGAGFVDAVAAAADDSAEAGARDDELVPVTVSGPTGADVPATVLLTTRDGVRTAYLESAQVVGRHLAPGADPARTTSAGVAALLRAAVAAGATRVVVGCGPAATNDGGAGLLAALGAGDRGSAGERLLRGGGALHDLPDDALAGLADVRAGLAGVELVAATDDDLPLLGFHGLSATSAPQLGASAEQAQQLERALGRYSD
ncbi:MAG TPA: glycerate kinase, partial [Actinomycetales bacterium]